MAIGIILQICLNTVKARRCGIINGDYNLEELLDISNKAFFVSS